MPNMMPYDRRGHSLWNGLDNFERLFFEGFGAQSMPFRTDIVDKGDRYQLSAELPGMRQEDIEIELRGDNLIITAKNSAENTVEEQNFVRKERRSGTYTRSFDVSGIDTDEIAASYNDGVLEISLPKAKGGGSQHRKIDVK